MKMLLAIGVSTAVIMSLPSSGSTDTADFIFQKPIVFNGTGCSSLNSHEVTGIDTSNLSLNIQGYDAGKDSVSGLGRSGCSFALPIKLSQGFQISHVIVDWGIYVRGKGQLKRKFFLSGSPWNQWQTSNFSNSAGDSLTVSDKLTHNSLAANCKGGLFTIRVNSQISVMDKQSYIQLSPNNGSSRITFKIKLKEC